MEILDLIIIGAGPAGIATAIEARRACIKRILLLEKGPTHSFLIEKLYTPGKRVDRLWQGHDVLCEGVTCIMDGTRESVLQTFEKFVRRYELPIEYEVEVTAIRRARDLLVVEDSRSRSWTSRTAVIAIGVYGRPNRPDYPIPGPIKGRVRFDLATPLPKGDSVMIVGGGNTALEYAAFLHPTNPTMLIYRGTEFTRANEVNRRILEELVARGQVSTRLGADIASLAPDRDSTGVEVRLKDGSSMRADHVVYAIGGSTPEAFLKQAGVAFEGKRPIFDAGLQTSVPGLFLAGDLVADGHGSIVKALNSGQRVVREGLCEGPLAPTSRKGEKAPPES
jgi:thioredoxin reductase (NADPH)